MIAVTTPMIEGFKIKKYLGLVTGEAVSGIIFFKDWVARMKDYFGGNIRPYEDSIKEAEKKAIQKMVERAESIGANAVIGVITTPFPFSPNGKGTVVGVSVLGTAVYVEEEVKN